MRITVLGACGKVDSIFQQVKAFELMGAVDMDFADLLEVPRTDEIEDLREGARPSGKKNVKMRYKMGEVSSLVFLLAYRIPVWEEAHFVAAVVVVVYIV
jgi:hypothetical protein